MDYYYCSIYKKTSEGISTFFQRGISPLELSNFTVPLPPSPLTDWNFCIIGFRRETGNIPLCQKAVKLQELIHQGSVFTIS